MSTRHLRLIACAVVFSFATLSSGDERKSPAVENSGFEKGDVGKAPPGWFFPPICAKDGYQLVLSEEQPFAGKRCAILKRDTTTSAEAFGNLLQTVDATPFRGKRIRFKAAVRAEVKGD